MEYMKKLIIYFHGYGSSQNSDKATRLRQDVDFNVYAFNIDIDPDVAKKHLIDCIDMALIDDLEAPEELVFVGTSLGAWWASKMAALYDCKAVLINPSVDPANSLLKYGVPKEICDKYSTFAPALTHKYFFAETDEVINNVFFRDTLKDVGFDVEIVKDSDHSFRGDPFEKVVKYLKTF